MYPRCVRVEVVFNKVLHNLRAVNLELASPVSVTRENRGPWDRDRGFKTSSSKRVHEFLRVSVS